MKLCCIAFLILVNFQTYCIAEENNRITYPYIETGVTIFTPAGVNLMLGYTFDYITIRLAGMYLGPSFGFQSELDFNLGNDKDFKHGPSLIVGYVDATSPSGFQYIINGRGVRGLILGIDYYCNLWVLYASIGCAATLINPNTNPPFTFLLNFGLNKRLF